MKKLENPIQATIVDNFDHPNGGTLGFGLSSLSKVGNSVSFVPDVDNSHMWEMGSLLSMLLSHPDFSPMDGPFPKSQEKPIPRKKRASRSQILSHPILGLRGSKGFSLGSEPTFPRRGKAGELQILPGKNTGTRGCPEDPDLEVSCSDKPGILAPCQAWESFCLPKKNPNQGMGEL